MLQQEGRNLSAYSLEDVGSRRAPTATNQYSLLLRTLALPQLQVVLLPLLRRLFLEKSGQIPIVISQLMISLVFSSLSEEEVGNIGCTRTPTNSLDPLTDIDQGFYLARSKPAIRAYNKVARAQRLIRANNLPIGQDDAFAQASDKGRVKSKFFHELSHRRFRGIKV